jgi:large subunit ribosomal protein L23
VILRPETTLVRPIVTEKAETAKAGQNKYVFQVARQANKLDVRKAVERYFRVKVAKVAVVNVGGKPKRMGAFTGTRPDWKKAIVTLKPGQKIEMLERV